MSQSASSSLVQGPTRVIPLSHLLNATSTHTLDVSDLRYFSVVDVASHASWAPQAGVKLLFFARRSVVGAPGALPVLRSLSTWALALQHDRLEWLASVPAVPDYALASNLDVVLAANSSSGESGGTSAVLYGLGGHHLAWDERHRFSQLSKHEPRRLRPRDGLRLLRATRLDDVLRGAWLPWSQFVPAAELAKELSRGGKRHKAGAVAAPFDPAEAAARAARKASVVIDGRHPGCLEVFNRYAPVCFYDSKMSLTRFRGRYLVFARANTVDRGGGRFVQVAQSTADDPAGPYGPFGMISIDGYTTVRSGNIYTAVVREHPLEPTMLLGLFSVNEGVPRTVNKDGKCYIALSLSCDGRR